MSLVAHHVRAGQVVGERRSTKRGTSVEFADYRDYTRGDDLRRVDWNIYARLERPFVKLFEEEEDLAVHILLDGSGSMEWGGEETRGQGDMGAGGRGSGGAGGQGSGGAGERGSKGTRGQGDKGRGRGGDEGREENKWVYARRVAGALGYVALMSGDRLTVVSLQPPVSNLQSPVSSLQFGPTRGRGNALRLFEWLEALPAGGTTDLNGSLRAYAVAGGRAGLAVLISDLFSPAGYAEGLTALAARGHEVALIHVLAPEEAEPPLGGDVRLLDVETGDVQEVTIDAGMRALYRRRLAAWREEIRVMCRARDVRYVPVETDMPFERVVLYELRRVGVVR